MERIICERGLWPEGGLPAECASLKCPEGPASCCCWHLLFTQPNFVSQKALLEEHIKLHGHLYNYCSKYHCKLNFIKQYWGVVKFRFCIAGCARTLREMEKKMVLCLNDIPLERLDGASLFLFHFMSETSL